MVTALLDMSISLSILINVLTLLMLGFHLGILLSTPGWQVHWKREVLRLSAWVLVTVGFAALFGVVVALIQG